MPPKRSAPRRKSRAGRPGRPVRAGAASSRPKAARLSGATALALISAAALVVVAAVFLVPEQRLSGGYDWAFVWSFHKEFLREAVLGDGTVPMWSRWSFSGKPFLADPQSMLFYPGTLVYILFPAVPALVVDVLAHFALAGVGMFLFLRSRALSVGASMFGALAFLACGFNLAHTTVGHVHYFAALAWMPFVFLSVERWIRSRAPGWIALGGLAAGVQFFAGAPAVSWITFVFGGLYGAGRALEAWLDGRAAPAGDPVPGPGSPDDAWTAARSFVAVGGVGLLLGLGLLISCVQLLPTLELQSLSVREGKGFDYAASESLPPSELAHLLAPAQLDRETAWEKYGYLGLAPFALAAVAIAGGPRRTIGWTPVALSGLALLMMLGDATPVFRLLYATVPGLGSLRAHARDVLALTFFVVLMGATAFDALLRRASSGPDRRLRAAMPVAAGVTGALALVLAVSVGGDGAQTATALWLTGALGTLGLAVALRADRPWVPLALCALLLVDVLGAERIVRGRIKLTGRQPATQETLAEVIVADDGDYRFWFPRKFFLSNRGYSAGRSAIEGYENMYLTRYRSYIHAMSGAPVKPDVITILTQTNFTHAPSPFPFDLLNVKYAAMPRQGGTYELFVNPDPCGPAFLVDGFEVRPEAEILELMSRDDFDPRRIVYFEEPPQGTEGESRRDAGEGSAGEVSSIVHDGPNRVSVSVDARRDAFLVLSEIHYPGWSVTVDGASRPLLRADALLRAVAVGPGTHTVEFAFRPAPMGRGLALSGAGLAACVGLFAASRRRPRRTLPTEA